MKELNEQDKIRLEQQADIIYDNSPDVLDAYDIVLRLMMEIATYEHNYQRERVSSLTKERQEMVEVELCNCKHHYIITGTLPLCFACTGKKKYLLSKFEP